MIRRRLNSTVSALLEKLAPIKRSREVAGHPTRAGIIALLGLGEFEEYARARALQRNETMERLSQCSPANSSPEALSGYVGEAALRFFHTMELIELTLKELALPRARMLEIGSNPYFLTLLIAERFPQVEHLGVNYFGAAVPNMETQGITDARHRLKETRFLHADIERHDLASAGQFDVALFCEVLEHLPYDPAWALHNIARRLRPGAHIILTTPNPARLDNLVRLIERRDTISDPISAHGIHGRHNREYSVQELGEMLHGTGFRVLGFKSIDVLPDIHSRDAEARGYGAYHLVRAVLLRPPTLFRPEWLYRGFSPEMLARNESLAPPGGV